jgi:UDP-N-acetylmuramoyl-tripeptide--D-alanyl-D-alanine ligase
MQGPGMTIAVPWVLLAGGLAASLRWLRVGQREHYIALSVTRFEGRWLKSSSANLALGLATAGAAVLALWWPYACLAAGAGLLVWPLGLGLRGRTAKLAWTPRLRRLAMASGLLFSGVAAVGFGLGSLSVGAIVAALAVPQVVDSALGVMGIVERRLTQGFVDRAARRLRSVAPKVVAVTGSFGKTSTKEYARHLLSAAFHAVASPASFNNRLGLARAINDGLDPGVEVLIAEMGTYGAGEIADLCSWIPPDVAVWTMVGPAHLERFGSLEAIAAAKAEILEDAAIAVVNWDDPLVRGAVEARRHLRVVRCSATSTDAEVSVLDEEGCLVVRLAGEEVGRLAAGSVFPINLACAVGVAQVLGVPAAGIAGRLSDLPHPAHRGSSGMTGDGLLVIDDTYNANPLGSQAAVERLSGAVVGRAVLVTPGMVELGRCQFAENRKLGEFAAERLSDVVVVGRTNRRALLKGARGRACRVWSVPDRQAAVAWVRGQLGGGDGVLYENDLPDHYP